MDIYEAIKTRGSVRSYKPEAIPAEILDRILDAMRLAPSGCNFQPWKFIVVKDEAKRKALVEPCRGQAFVGEAPVVVVGCGWDDKSYQKMGAWGTSLDVDVAVALDHLMLAAAAEGLGTCWIGAFKADEVKEVLAIPDEVKVVALTPLGYPTDATSPTPRKGLEEIVCSDTWED